MSACRVRLKQNRQRYFGLLVDGYDLRSRRLEEGNIKIMELNGFGAEPAHTFDTRMPIAQESTMLVKYRRYTFAILRGNRIPEVSRRKAFTCYRRFRSAVK